MKTVHMTLQGKGGVGKSFVASLLAQYHLEKGLDTVCIDADPINATFSRYKAFQTRQFDLMERNEVEMAKLDELMEMMISEDSHFIVDNGVASFLPMSNYLVGFGAVEALEQADKRLMIHTVITGDQGLLDTLENFTKIATQMPPQVQIMLWLNEHFGPISFDGKTFEEMKTYKAHKDRLAGIIQIPQQQSLFSRNLRTMLDRFLTFDEAITGTDFRLLEKQRLTMVRRDLFEKMAVAL